MSFNHKDMATQGLWPKRAVHKLIANLGHWFAIEIRVLEEKGGAATTTDLRSRKDKYKVIMRVTYKTRTWEFEQEVSK